MTETTANKVLFDPGFAKHTTILSISSEYLYDSINKIKNFNQKKIKFKMVYPQILKMADNNVGFCLGCILWAIYIKNTENNALIEGNPCFGDTYNESETVEEIDFSIEFFNKIKKDAKYYLGLDYEINPFYIKVLNLYREFLILNKNFVNTKTTADIEIPASLKTPSKQDLTKIYEKIQEVIKSGKLLELTEVFELC